jgi:hypothetical protein
MHFPSIYRGILLVLAILVVHASASPKKKPPPTRPKEPVFSTVHHEDKESFEYCEQWAPLVKTLPKANVDDFDNLCDNIPNQLTLPVWDSKQDPCQRFTNGTTIVEYSNWDICSERKLVNQLNKCNALTLSCFGSQELVFGYTATTVRFRNLMGYMTLMVNGSTTAWDDLQPTCNGMPAPDGKMPEQPNIDKGKQAPSDWWVEMEQHISSYGV